MEYITEYEDIIKSNEYFIDLTEFINFTEYAEENLKNLNITDSLESNKRKSLYFISIILDIHLNVSINYYKTDKRDTRRHLFHLLLTTQLVRDFLTNLEVLVSNEAQREIFQKFISLEDSNFSDKEKRENILKQIIRYLE
jgi:hypothetical protein